LNAKQDSNSFRGKLKIWAKLAPNEQGDHVQESSTSGKGGKLTEALIDW
jgi:hypothetical protein